MKILLVCPTEPRSDGKGYAIRAAALSAALTRSHEVRIFIPQASRLQRIGAALRDLAAGLPAQVGYSLRPREWRRIQREAARVELVLAVTVRMVRGPLPVPLIVDHVDALSRNWLRRASGPESLPTRLVARLEAARLRTWERRAAGWSSAQLAVNQAEAAALPTSAPVYVLEHIAMFDPPAADQPRNIDVVLTGYMRYPPNREAALWLDREIAPALLRLRPQTRVVVAGRGAGRLDLRNVEVMPDVPSIPELLVRSRVAIVPLSGTGSGVPTKAIEAAMCGAALVVTPWVHDQLALPARVADDADGLAAETARLLDCEPARAELAEQARSALPADGVEATAQRLEDILAATRRQ